MRFPAPPLERIGLLFIWLLMFRFSACARKPPCPEYSPPTLEGVLPDDEACQLSGEIPGCDLIYPTRRCDENDPSCGPEPYSTGRKRACYDADAPRIVSSALNSTLSMCQHDAECFIDFTCGAEWGRSGEWEQRSPYCTRMQPRRVDVLCEQSYRFPPKGPKPDYSDILCGCVEGYCRFFTQEK